MGYAQYLMKKGLVYIVTFIFAVTINWLLGRAIPGNPLLTVIGPLYQAAAQSANANVQLRIVAEQAKHIIAQMEAEFSFNKPPLTQYLIYWNGVLHGNLGLSVQYFPRTVLSIILQGLPYDVVLVVPSVLIAWWVGNKLGALAATHPRLDRIVMPVFYVLNAAPYFWLGLMLIYALSVEYPIFPATGAYSGNMLPNLSFSFVLNFLWHLVLPVLSFVIVGIGGWGLGMRNLMIYELGANYSKYLEAMGGRKNLITSYAFKNAELPQITGLALSFGNIIAGAIGIETVFWYPGVGFIIYGAITAKDYFLAMGGFLFIIIDTLVANFLVDILYGFIDPRIKYTYTEG
jgi:peptide/nickel transport system permease protein